MTAALTLAVLVSCSSLSYAQKQGVEVWMNGSDIETPKHTATEALRDSIEAAVSHSSDMELSAAHAGSVRITIPTDVILAREGDIVYVLFVVNVSLSTPAHSTDVSGYCRYDELANCAEKVLTALRSLHRIAP
jgi:hypothetical protein